MGEASLSEVKSMEKTLEVCKVDTRASDVRAGK